jgi:hypothetical protein
VRGTDKVQHNNCVARYVLRPFRKEPDYDLRSDFMQVALQQIVVSPCQQLLLKNVSWQQFQEILTTLGESRSSRIAYSQEMLEIMVPLPEHETDKVIIGDLVKAILEEIDIEFLSLGSTTFENEQMLAAANTARLRVGAKHSGDNL